MCLSAKPIISQKPFLSAPYEIDKKGHPRPKKPLRCPLAESDDNSCNIQFEKWRRRIHGPGFDFAVFQCLSHRRSFTIYPPGWVPYGRKALVLLDHRGEALQHVSGECVWKGTLFDAVLDGGKEAFWPEEISLGPTKEVAQFGSRKTQRRHIAGAMRLFSLTLDDTQRTREKVAGILGMDLVLFEKLATRIRDGPGLLARGRGGEEVLKTLHATGKTAKNLIRLGAGHAFWGHSL
jgi:hypothetical protein